MFVLIMGLLIKACTCNIGMQHTGRHIYKHFKSIAYLNKCYCTTKFPYPYSIVAKMSECRHDNCICNDAANDVAQCTSGKKLMAFIKRKSILKNGELSNAIKAKHFN